MNVSVKVSKRTRVSFRHGWLLLILATLLLAAVVPWLVLIAGSVAVLAIIARWPHTVGKFLIYLIVSAVILGLPVFGVLALIGINGALQWALPASAVAVFTFVMLADGGKPSSSPKTPTSTTS